MERPVKERLVGAAVLMAAAIILIPEMLSGPDHDEQAAPAANADTNAGGKGAAPMAGQSNAPIKTYTIDLSQSPGTSAVISDETRAPPPDEIPALAPEPPQSAAVDAQAKPEPADGPPDTPSAVVEERTSEASPAASSAPAPVVEAPTRSAPAVANPPPRPLASTPAAPTSGAWAVQLGSFAKQATAERLMRELRAQGHEAFVMPVKSGAATLYRVRIGPMKDRANAEATLRGVKPKMPGATVVAHP